MKKLILILILPLSIVVNGQILSPDVVATSGDYYTNSNVSLSWTLGEISVETYVGSNVLLTQGFQQPEFFVTSIFEKKPDGFLINIYPNPATEYFTISCESNNEGDFNFELYDVQGKMLLSDYFTSSYQIDISNYKKAMYLLKVYSKSSGEFLIYKILKK